MEKKKKIVTIILILAIIVLACLEVYVCLNYEKNKQNKTSAVTTKKEEKKKETIKEDETKEEDKDIEINYEGEQITDQNLKEDLSVKVSKILSFGNSSSKQDYSSFIVTADTNILEYSKLINYKTAIILNSHFKEFENLGDNDGTLVFSTNTVIDEFYQLFNEKITKEQLASISGRIGACPYYQYNATSDRFETRPNCGGVGYPHIIMYKNAYTKNGDNINVYISLATYSRSASGVYSLHRGAGYSDITDENYLYDIELKANEAEQEYDIKDEALKNYKKYAQYKVVFKKNNETNNYYFANIEKIG